MSFTHIFSGTAHLSTVQKICHFCNASKDELKEHLNIKDWLLRCKDIYNYRIEQLDENSRIVTACGIKKSLCLNDLNYFHVIEVLPSDIAHDVFESLAVDVISDILHVLVKDKCLTLQKSSIRRATFKQSNSDKAIKQQLIKIIYGSNFKLKRQHVRYGT